MICEYKTHYTRKSSWIHEKDIDFEVQCQKEKGHEGWCDYNDGKSMIGWKAKETMNEKELLDSYLSMLMRYCEDKYAYRTEIPEILNKIRAMIK